MKGTNEDDFVGHKNDNSLKINLLKHVRMSATVIRCLNLVMSQFNE
jgi:hypothetical protein